jgi:hypothetical protein
MVPIGGCGAICEMVPALSHFTPVLCETRGWSIASGPMLENFESAFNYLVVTPGLVLSEHPTIGEARRARNAAITEGFSEVIIMTRTAKGWEPQADSHSKG